MTRSAKMSAKRIDDTTMQCGDWLLHLAESEDPLPLHAAAVILEVITRTGAQPVLWIEVYTPKREVYALAAPVTWSVAPDCRSWIVGDVFELAVGPLGIGFTVRPRIAAILSTVMRASAVGSPAASSAKPTEALAQIERRARQGAPQEFAVLAGAMRALESGVDDVESEPDVPGRH